MKKVIVLQHVACEGLGTIASALRNHDLSPVFIRTYEGEPVPTNLAGESALIVMGGPMSVYEANLFPHLMQEQELIRNTIRANKPVLGICLGSQLIAAALGADVHAGARKEIGWHTLTLSCEAATDELFTGLPAQLEAFHWHGDVFDLPQGAVRLASSNSTQIQAFRYGTAVYGLLFHFEVDAELIEQMTENFASEMTSAHVSAKAINDGTEQHLHELVSVGAKVFSRWAQLVAL